VDPGKCRDLVREAVLFGLRRLLLQIVRRFRLGPKPVKARTLFCGTTSAGSEASQTLPQRL
jgi:hypothetical protein